MNRKETEEAIKVMQAFVDGAELEIRSRGYPTWESAATTTICWSWDRIEYRIKPKPLEVWVTVRNGDNKPAGVYASKNDAETCLRSEWRAVRFVEAP